MTPAVAFVGRSGSGKTTLLERLVPVLKELGYKPGCLKGSHHGFTIDHEGKDSDRLFRAGAERVVVASHREGALRFRVDVRDARGLVDEHFRGCDFVLAEGFRTSDLPKIEVRRGGEPLVEPGDPTLVGLVSDEPDERAVPRLGFGELDRLAALVVRTALGRMGGSP